MSLACWQSCSSVADGKARFEWNIDKAGWQPIAAQYEEHVVPVLKATKSPLRLFLHNPGGQWPRHDKQIGMVMDQMSRAAADPKLRKVVETFKTAWKPVIERGSKVVAYVGFDVAFKLSASTRLNKLRDSFSLILSTGCGIAFDAAGPKSIADKSRFEPAVIRMFQAMGVECYPEGGPIAPEWKDTPVILEANNDNEHWRAHDPTAWGAESILTIFWRDDWALHFDTAREGLKRGYTVALGPIEFKEHGERIVKELA